METQVLTRLRERTSTGFDSPVLIGSAARLISGVRGTTVNNIEENFLLGCDCITTRKTLSDGTLKIRQEFRSDNVNENYYYIITFHYTKPSLMSHWIDDKTLFIAVDKIDSHFNDNTVIFDNVDTYSWSDSYNDKGHTFKDVIIDSYKKEDILFSHISQLYYQGANGTYPKLVADKIYYNIEEEDGNIIEKEIIRNYL